MNKNTLKNQKTKKKIETVTFAIAFNNYSRLSGNHHHPFTLFGLLSFLKFLGHLTPEKKCTKIQVSKVQKKNKSFPFLKKK